MPVQIYNSLTNRKEVFKPIEKGKVKLYVCGVTVYDDIHMGHARSMIVFDMVVKYLRHVGYEVMHVTNFTDVDDKIIKRANEEGMAPLDLSARYIKRYFEDVERLGISPADLYPKASESMDDILRMVGEIVDNGYGYPTDEGSVYFEVNKVKEYGKLSNRRLEDMEPSGRIASDESKRNPMDFAIWKAAKPGECHWDSKWGCGRPGWHIECSAMIRRHLGETIDIHGGGSDLIFPHHENEIIQTESVTDRPLANYWMHNGMLQTEGEKMSKSLGNFFTVREVSEIYDAPTIRFYFLSAHYASPLTYSEAMLEEAKAALGRIWNGYLNLKDYVKVNANMKEGASLPLNEVRQRFMDAMDDDFNTSSAIDSIFSLIRDVNRSMADKSLSIQSANDAIGLLEEFDSILGILPSSSSSSENMDKVMDIIIAIRKELRSRKQYDLADMIRDRLGEAGLALEDTAEGVKWKKI